MTLETELDPIDMPPAPPPTPVPELNVENEDDAYARLIAEPLDPGYGTTLGNSLRRILLSSLEGAAITSVRIDQVQHEFSTIDGMQEDSTEFLLNVKEIRLKAVSNRPGTLTLDAEGAGEITAGDLKVPADFEVVNPSHHLATLDGPKARLNAEFHAQLERGYMPATEVEGMPIGVIPVDAVFSPVRKVNFHVEKVRVGQATDFDRLVLEVWTDGSVSPVEAVGQAADILIEQFALFSPSSVVGAPPAPPPAPTTSLPISPERYHTPIEALQLSVRAYNCLRRSGLMTIGQVLERSEDELLALRNFGHKSYDELRDRLIEMNYVDGNAPGLEIVPDVASLGDSQTESSGIILDGEEDEESLGALGKALREALREVGDDDLLGADDEE
ncbi:MAG TPA: DNA-directed RNA polymerase subunit alpha [Dehalococcoidia bacterium]|mgnify:CR=1 FL=1|nr:DNA-directed RNA polymerase subunit alpha [Dehalococcoidia bacterium]|tara:strand:+ start:63 stop:1223 length:1161 start_codon:yes stop_codon:yes gene_type:complete